MEQTVAMTKLREWRKSKALTLAEAGAKVGTSRQVWFGWESGRRRPNATFMARLRTLTGGKLTADDFFVSDGTPEAEAA